MGNSIVQMTNSAGDKTPCGPEGYVRHGVQTVSRVGQLLREIAIHNQRGLSSSEVAQILGLSYPTAHRMLQSLVENGLLVRRSKTKCYVLGQVVYELGLTAQWHFELQKIFRPKLAEMARKTGETLFLVVRSGPETVCLDRVRGNESAGGLPRSTGSRRPLGVGVSSIAILSLLEDHEIGKIISRNKGRFFSYDELDESQLQADIEKCRAAGYAVRERAISNATALSVATTNYGPDEQTVAIALCSFEGIMKPDRQRELGAMLQETLMGTSAPIFPPAHEKPVHGSCLDDSALA